MNKNQDWLLIKYSNTQQAGGYKAINDLYEFLTARGIEAKVFNFTVKDKKPRTRKVVNKDADTTGLQQHDD